jgi:multidrug efflux pump subunit AcrB
VVREASIAALLTALMILLFLGSWRSTLIVCISIPLSILTSLTVLGLLGETINVMTLGGWLSPSEFWWTMRRLRSKTSIATWG